jgi:hypothetical protein
MMCEKIHKRGIKKLMKRTALTALVAGILAFSFIPQLYFTIISNPNYSGKEENIGLITASARSESIAIYYDPINEKMEDVALASYQLIYSSCKSIELVPIRSLDDLINNLNKHPQIAIYAFDANLIGPKMGSQQISWELFYNTLKSYPTSEHIVGLPNTLTLQKIIQGDRENLFNPVQNSNQIHLSEVEQTDTAILVLYNLWGVSKIYQQQAPLKPKLNDTANALTATALKIYTENFNYFFQAQYEPMDVIGELDQQAAEERKAQMWDRHKPTITPTAYLLKENGILEEIPEERAANEISPQLKLISKEEAYDTRSPGDDFILGDLPIFSGLQGPIGEIVDVLLGVLSGSGNSVLAIPNDLMEQIKNVFNILQPLLGITKDFNLESPLKALLEVLGNEFPFVEDLKPFLNIFIKALFNFRGGITDIQAIIGEILDALIESILPESVGNFVNDILGAGASLGTLLQEVVSSGKNTFDVLASFFMENVLDRFLNKTLVATLGLTSGQVSDILTRMKSFFSSIVNYAVSFDLKGLITDLSSDVIQTVLGALNPAMQSGLNKVTELIKMGLGIIDLVDNFDAESAVTLLSTILNSLLGGNIIGNIESTVRPLLDIIKKYKEQGLNDLNAFKNEILNQLNKTIQSSVSTQVREVIRDILALMAGVYNKQFSLASLPDIIGLAKNILDISGIPTTDLNNLKAAIDNIFTPILGIVAMITKSGNLKQLLFQSLTSLFPEFADLFNLSGIQSIQAITSLLKKAINYFDLGNIFDSLGNFNSIIDTFGQVAGGIFQLINSIRGKSFQGVLQSLWVAVSAIVGVHPSFNQVPINMLLKLLQNFFPSAFGLQLSDLPNPKEIITELINLATPYLTGIIDPTLLQQFLDFAFNIKDLFTRGLDWIVGKVLDWLTGLLNPILNDIENSIESVLGGNNELLGYHGVIPIGLGEWSLFDLKVDLGLKANFNLDLTPLFDMIKSLILDDRQALKLSSLGDFFKVFLNMFEISPQFYANLGVQGLDSSKNSFMQFLLESLGLDLSFTGSAKFLISLFTFRGGVFEWEHFFEVLEWGFTIKIQLSKTFTLLDFLTGGVGGGVLGTLAEYLGLDAITVTVSLGMELDIVKRAATADKAEESTLTLIITLGASLHIGIDLLIVSVSFDGSLEIILTFFMDFASGDPMKITLRLVLTLKLKLFFLFDDIKKTWTWEPGGPWDLSPKKGEPEYEASGIGFDSDQDGLSDDYENKFPGLNPQLADTDGDGASDKLEVMTMGTDPSNPDCDGEGLLDGEEWDIGTNPIRPDSDWDRISDYEEEKIYKTDPLSQDTDGDGLTDDYEIYTPLDVDNITQTVEQVLIGSKTFTDRTDPLNRDTDGDGLIDGDEGEMGAYYGLDTLYNETDAAVDPNPLIFNYGYTHPLDADTDDDSYLQLYNGMIDSQALSFLKDMNDGAEVAGFDIILYDSEGEPELKHVFTNPVNPDTDGDTGITDRTPQPGAWINSDGYELAQTPPTDPTDGDTDDDGLLDGLEGVLSQYSNHTNPTDPDTDDDGLYDMHEMLLKSDPRKADSDGDMIPDGDEFYIFYTNPNMVDCDLDGVEDGEEVYYWHSDPLSDDSDGDGILDGREIYIYGSDPMDEDSDDDGLLDYEEIFIYLTNPFDYDSDDDDLSDGEEVETYKTDPLNWDTDGDSIIEPNALGQISWSMSDYDEVVTYKTNSTNADTDSDGLSDGIELYIASGIIPWSRAIALNPKSNDTDGDGFADGSELMLKNVTDIIYPFRAITFVFPYSTFPDIADTDNDNISDYLEAMVYSSNTNHTDSDNDTLTDWQEIVVYNTSALYNDTDGDGLLDVEEINITPASSQYIIANIQVPFKDKSLISSKEESTPIQATYYGTDPLNPDSDGDGLPDGAEVFLYKSNPINTDSDSDGVPDGNEYDTDSDGLSDAIEFSMGLQRIAGGGIMNPDSDFDGLLDGDEYYIYHTLANSSDTDGDGYADGTEISIGTDPLVFTSKDEFEKILTTTRGSKTIDILLPRAGKKNYQNTPIRVVNLTDFQEMKFRYRKSIVENWSEYSTLRYEVAKQQWVNDSIRWENGTYKLQVSGLDLSGITHMVEIEFIVQEGDEPNYWLWGGIIGAVAVGSIIAITITSRKRKKAVKGDRDMSKVENIEDTIVEAKSDKKLDTISTTDKKEPTNKVVESVNKTDTEKSKGTSTPKPQKTTTNIKSTQSVKPAESQEKNPQPAVSKKTTTNNVAKKSTNSTKGGDKK